MSQKTPILLLKTKSVPGDAYEELFSSPPNGPAFDPSFVPVLEHRFDEPGMAKVRSALQDRTISTADDAVYGGLIFTSQRAVEAFTKLAEERRGEDGWPHLQDVPVYNVGPATTRALKAVPQAPSLQIFGEHTGTGEKLAPFILEHYGAWYRDREVKPPLLFLVGEKRRDVIPNMLTRAGWRVDEVVIYGTRELKSFKDEFTQRLEDTADRPRRWVVVFSPSGCDSMLSAMGLLDESTGKAKPKRPDQNIFVATIGPTTRDHLVQEFGYEPDVCAEQPTPEGLWQGISRFSSCLE
ncbi:tetrapyrrole biosynthesis, uroporphyrinogen III synthase [Parathielavia appendiculata]|uniref:Tetrapyrrole biosynthesis, uroporphyrinogen III synthase n=1 Tax=Parathielavia appendiculata TaxID=2587402 RepID=A0AAN6Z3S2_9PEZI|nr:tetrapyrrole biosynthesis, uroporphyrinogen III synthase [Parathielavia appendiculata]